jgi:hypothetical protein
VGDYLSGDQGLNFPWKVTWHELHSTNNQVFDQAWHSLVSTGVVWGVIPLVAGFILLVQGANRLALSRNVLMRAVTTQTVGFPRTLVIEPRLTWMPRLTGMTVAPR